VRCCSACPTLARGACSRLPRQPGHAAATWGQATARLLHWLIHCHCPQSADVVETVAALALRARLKECRACKVSVACDTLSLLAGRISGVKITGEGWRR